MPDVKLATEESWHGSVKIELISRVCYSWYHFAAFHSPLLRLDLTQLRR